jgi:putative ABC transport system permease protein
MGAGDHDPGAVFVAGREIFMRRLRAWCWRFAALFRKEQWDQELAAELESHVQMHIQDYLHSGMNPAEARRQALIALGGVAQVKENYRERRGIPLLEAFLQDARYASRILRRNPGFTTVVILTLALGIGPSTAVFSIVSSMLLRPLPVSDPSRIVSLFVQQDGNTLQSAFSIPDYRDIENGTSDAFSGFTAQRELVDGLSVNGKAERVMDLYVTGNFFSLLGIKPALGRFILPSEGESVLADPVMVLSFSYWKTRFGGDPDIIGKTVSVDGQPITVVGVAPEGFYGVNPWGNIQGYLPLGMAPISGVDSNDFMTNRGYRAVTVLGRLRSGVSLDQAEASLSVEAERLSKDHSTEDAGLRLPVFPELNTRLGDPRTGTPLLVSGLFFGLALVVLLVACMNVANILIVHTTVRQREMAVRAALGAGPGRLIRQLLTQGALLALGGGLIGTMLGWLASAAAGSVDVETDLPLRLDFSFDWRVLTYALASTLVVGVIVGIAATVQVSGANLNSALHGSGRGTTGNGGRVRSAMVVAQVGSSMMLLIVAGLFARSLNEAEHTSLGFEANHLVNFTMDPLLTGSRQAEGTSFFKNLLDRLRALPGVLSVSTAFSAPMSYITVGDGMTISGYEPPPGQPGPRAQYNTVSSDYFKNMRIAIAEGRSFTDSDDGRSDHVAIVNEAFVRRYWPNQDPIGRTFKMISDPQHTLRVVGVAANVRYQGVTGPVAPYFYIPFSERPWDDSWETVQIRTTRSPESMIPELKRILDTLAPGQPVWDVQTMNQALYTLPGLLIFQAGARLAAFLGGIALILTIVGVYGVVSYTTSRKSREIGIRMALGARPIEIFRMVIRHGIIIVGTGLVVGLGATLAATSIVRKFLIVSSTDSSVYLLVSAVLALVALLACLVPAWRAMCVDPMVALRHE